MNKYARVVFLTKTKTDAKEIWIGNGKEKCFLFQKESLSRSKCNLTKMNCTINKIKKTKIKIIQDKKAITITIIIIIAHKYILKN
jgi:hypothetical protein